MNRKARLHLLYTRTLRHLILARLAYCECLYINAGFLLQYACLFFNGPDLLVHKWLASFPGSPSLHVSLIIPGLHGSVLVTNEHGVPAHFLWHAREGVETDTFFVMHPTGG